MTTQPRTSPPLDAESLRAMIDAQQQRVTALDAYLRKPGAMVSDIADLDAAKAELARLLEELTERHRLDVQRDEREQAASAEIDAMSVRITAAQKKTRAAYTAMQRAVVALVDAAREQRTAVEEVRERMVALDLPATIHPDDHRSGFTRDAVRIRGAWHLVPSTTGITLTAFTTALATRARNLLRVPGMRDLTNRREMTHAAANALGGALPNPPAAVYGAERARRRSEVAPVAPVGSGAEVLGERPFLMR